jgi:hypothetical protein
MAKIKWAEVVQKSVPIFESFLKRGVTPTLRAVYYALVSTNVIPNTKGAYQGLGGALVDARKDGRINWGWMADETRSAEGGDHADWEAEEYAEACVTQMFDRLHNFKLPRWKNQPYYVEVWIEKFALARTFQTWLKTRNVTLVPSRGYSSWSFLVRCASRIKTKAAGREVKIVYFGDFDPSGADIERFIGEALRSFGVDVEVERVAVTEEQIQEHSLPSVPEDAEEIEKLQRDPRYLNWEHGLFRVELDALLAIVPDEFERIVKASVDQYFDEDIHKLVVAEEKALQKQVSDLVEQKVLDGLEEYRAEIENADEDEDEKEDEGG